MARAYIQAFLLIWCLCIGRAWAQVGINAPNPNKNAVMELRSDNKGFLAPQVKLAQAVSPVPVAASGNIKYGIWVYNTNADTAGNGLKGKGYYYWDSTAVNAGKWVMIATSNHVKGNSWSLAGNTGIDSARNFLGNLDNRTLVFRVNNIRSGAINKKNTALGYQSMSSVFGISENSALGVGALSVLAAYYDDAAVGHFAMYKTTGGAGSALGDSALVNNTIAMWSTALGHAAMRDNTVGYNNIGLGVYALLSNTTGSYNIAIGIMAMAYSTKGSFNIGIGSHALDSVTTGVYNIGIGYLAGKNITTGSYNIVLGSASGGLTTSSPTAGYELNIGNAVFGTNIDTTTGMGKIGINTRMPRTTFEVNGSLSLRDTAVSSASYMVADNDYLILVNGTGVQTVTLPSAVLFPGRLLEVRYTGTTWVSGNMKVITNGVDRLVSTVSAISAGTTFVDSSPLLQLFSDGTNWFYSN